MGFFFRHRFHSGSGANPASYPMYIRDSYTRGNVAKAWSWPVTSI